MYRCSKFRHNYPKALARKDFTYSLALKGTPSSSFLESKAGYIIFFCCEESIFAAHESPSLHFLGNPFCETAFITDENCLAESSPVLFSFVLMRELDRRLEKLISSQQAKHCHRTWERVGRRSSCEQLSGDNKLKFRLYQKETQWWMQNLFQWRGQLFFWSVKKLSSKWKRYRLHPGSARLPTTCSRCFKSWGPYAARRTPYATGNGR